VLTAVRDLPPEPQARADLAAELQAAIVDVLVGKAIAAIEQTGLTRLVVAGGVGANQQLRLQLTAAAQRCGCTVFYPPFEFCTDNGAMIASPVPCACSRATCCPGGTRFQRAATLGSRQPAPGLTLGLAPSLLSLPASRLRMFD